MKVCAIIPARGGSKQLPRKNVALLGGVPLIAHTIQAANGCALVDACFVTTEDEEIKAISLAWGADVVDRPADLAQDHTTSEAVVRHTLETLAERDMAFECFVLLQPTSPLRTSVHLHECLDAFLRSSANSIVSVTEPEHHPLKCFRRDGGYLVPAFDPLSLTARRQDLPLLLRSNGAIYGARTSSFLEGGALMTPPILPYFMSQDDSVDIDSQRDLRFAEELFSGSQPCRDKLGGGSVAFRGARHV